MKKTVLGLFAMLMALPVLNVNVAAAEAQGNEASAYDNVATNVSQALIERADKYVTIEDNKFVYVENPELSAVEAAEVQAMIAEANERVEQAALEQGYVVEEDDDFIRVAEENPVLSTFGYGYRGIEFHWWGVKIWLNTGDVRAICQGGVGIIFTLIPAIGPAIGRKVAEIAGSLGCNFWINNGIWMHVTYGLQVSAMGWQA